MSDDSGTPTEDATESTVVEDVEEAAPETAAAAQVEEARSEEPTADQAEAEAQTATVDEKKAFLEDQRRKEARAVDIGRAFPEKHRLQGEMKGASDEKKLQLFRRLVLTREFDARMRRLFRQGRFEGTFYSQIGQEACDVVIAFQMR
jgi:hypothetical protein